MILEIMSNFSLGNGTPVRDLRFSEQKTRLSRSGFCVPIDTTFSGYQNGPNLLKLWNWAGGGGGSRTRLLMR